MAEPAAAPEMAPEIAPEIAPEMASSLDAAAPATSEPVVTDVDTALPAKTDAAAAATSTSTSAPDPAPVPAPAAAAAAATPGKQAPLSSKIKATPANIDAFISHLHRALLTRGGHDVTLLFIAYMARLSAAVLETLSRTALRHSARKLVALAFQLPPSATVTLSSAHSPPLATLALQLSMRLKALVAMLGEWRTMNRMWGLVGMWMSAKELVEKTLRNKEEVDEKGESKPVDKFEATVAAAQIVALTSYHTFEATAWLSSKKVLAWSPKAQDRMSSWSVRSWAAYVFMELGRLLVERSRKKRGGDVTVAWKDEWRTNFTRTLAWAPLTIHWSLPGGVLPEILVPIFASYPAVGLMRDLWRQTA